MAGVLCVWSRQNLGERNEHLLSKCKAEAAMKVREKVQAGALTGNYVALTKPW